MTILRRQKLAHLAEISAPVFVRSKVAEQRLDRGAGSSGRRLNASNHPTAACDEERLAVLLDRGKQRGESPGGVSGGDLLHGIRLSDTERRQPAGELFHSVFEARVVILDWLELYNTPRPHRSLGKKTLPVPEGGVVVPLGRAAPEAFVIAIHVVAVVRRRP